MAAEALLSLSLSLGILISLCSADWNILSSQRTRNGVKISLKNYCEGWRMNVELHNIREFEVVPEECVNYVGKYMKSTQYRVDSERAIEECIMYLSTSCSLKRDGRDAWIFDIDDTMLSTVPYYKKHQYGGEKLNVTSLEEWMSKAKAPALEHSLNLFNEIKARGIQIVLVSSRREHLRSATIDNLVNVGFHGWSSLVLRGPEDELKGVQSYKAEVRKKLVSAGYRIWGILGDQYSSIQGLPSAKRTFKLPNPLYYIS
ncbi:acid phosphatase 1-like [Rhodamnia argentea]|uniref:Acid phosphatase 1-like n=1 Tax=Rhodamnia argentea TaxID=178133 RepID=A0A8B8N2P8_9MYRT|nr:acid phosphatase 1-like [Rhodamnia argentea]